MGQSQLRRTFLDPALQFGVRGPDGLRGRAAFGQDRGLRAEFAEQPGVVLDEHRVTLAEQYQRAVARSRQLHRHGDQHPRPDPAGIGEEW
jgi:hypothetical protein